MSALVTTIIVAWVIVIIVVLVLYLAYNGGMDP